MLPSSEKNVKTCRLLYRQTVDDRKKHQTDSMVNVQRIFQLHIEFASIACVLHSLYKNWQNIIRELSHITNGIRKPLSERTTKCSLAMNIQFKDHYRHLFFNGITTRSGKKNMWTCEIVRKIEKKAPILNSIVNLYVNF